MLNNKEGYSLLDVDFILNKLGIEENMKIADLGCGSLGKFSFKMSNLVGRRGKIYAVDILKPVLATINRRIEQDQVENIETVWSDIEIFGATKIEASSLNIAVLINTLYQSFKKEAMLRESNRMIKKDGRLMIVEWKEISSPLGPPLNQRIKKDNIISIANTLGLELIEEFEAGEYHYGLIFVKL